MGASERGVGGTVQAADAGRWPDLINGVCDFCKASLARRTQPSMPMTSSDVIEPLIYRLELLISQAEKAGSNEDWTSVLLVFKEALATAELLNW
jgi:hypothetical protein